MARNSPARWKTAALFAAFALLGRFQAARSYDSLSPVPFAVETAERSIGRSASIPDTVDIEVSTFRFSPDTLRIEPGTVLRWTNRDPVPHTLTSDTGLWDSGLVGTGETFAMGFEKAGTFSYHCVPHPFMTATVIVVPRATPSP